MCDEQTVSLSLPPSLSFIFRPLKGLSFPEKSSFDVLCSSRIGREKDRLRRDFQRMFVRGKSFPYCREKIISAIPSSTSLSQEDPSNLRNDGSASARGGDRRRRRRGGKVSNFFLLPECKKKKILSFDEKKAADASQYRYLPRRRRRERKSYPVSQQKERAFLGEKKFPRSNKATKRNRRRKKVALSVTAEE